MSSFDRKLKQWTDGLKLSDTSTTLNEIRKCLSRPSKEISLQALHIFSKVVLPVYCSGENRTDDKDLLEMVIYLWSFSCNGPFKHFLSQLYSTIRGMAATKASCIRIQTLTPLLGIPNEKQADLHQVFLSINSVILYIFYTAKEPLGPNLSTALFKSTTEILKHQRSISLACFLEAFAAWFEKKTQTLLVMLTVDTAKTQELLDSAALFFTRREEQVPDKFRNQFWSIVESLVRFEAKFKGVDLVQTILGGVAQGALFAADKIMAAGVALFHEILLFKAQPLGDKSFSQLTKAVSEFLENVGDSEFPELPFIIAVGRLYEKLHKTNPVVSEPVCFEFMASLDRLMRWIQEKLVPGVSSDANWSPCKTCNRSKEHTLLQIAASIALTTIQPHFHGQTITERLFQPFLSILKINVLAMDRLECALSTRMKEFWLNTWWQLAKTYKPAQRRMSAQFLEIIGLVRAKRDTYAPKTVSDLVLLRLFELVYNAEVCQDLPVNDPMWDHTIDLMCTEAMMEVRKNAQRAVYWVLMLQKRNPKFRGLNIIQLTQRPEFCDFGFENLRGRLDRFAAIELQMWVTYIHYPDQVKTLVDLFNYVWRPEDAVQLAKLIQYFDEPQFQRLVPERVTRLKQQCAGPAPASTEDAFKVALGLGYLNYYLYVAEHELVKRAGRTANPTDKAVLQKELLPFIDQINMDHECKLLRLLDEALGHYTTLTRLLAANDQLFELIASPSKLMRCLDNLSLFYQQRYVEDKAMQAKCLVYVVAKRRAHLSAQLSCTSLFVDQPRLYEAVVASALGFKMPRTVRAFLDAHKDLADVVHQPQPDLAKTTLGVELAMKLAVYHAATGTHDRVERLVMRSRDLIQHYEGVADAKAHIWYMKVHFYHGLYLITFKHRMRWLASLHAAVDYVLDMFKNMADVPQDFLTQPTVIMQKMIPELLEFAATQKAVTDTCNSYLNMLIKYAIRQGYGLRAAQFFALSSKLALDREGMDECEVKLAYVDKVLMFYTSANLSEKSNYSGVETAPSATPIVASSLLDEVFTPIEPIRRDSGAPNGREFLSPITGANKQQPLRQMITTQQPQRRLSKYIIDHPDTCECGFCRYPQFRLVSFQTGCIYTRLLHMTGAHEISGKLYAKYFKCWSEIKEQVQTHRIMSATLTEAFGMFSAQFMVYYSQALVQSQQLDEAKSKLELAHRIARVDVQARNDGFRQEVESQSENVRLMLEAGSSPEARPKFVSQSYADFSKRTWQYKTPAKSQLVSIKHLSKSTVKKPPNRESFSYLISAEVGTSSQVTANDIFNDSSCIPERYKKRNVSKTPKTDTSTAKTPKASTSVRKTPRTEMSAKTKPKATSSAAKTPATVLRKKLNSAHSAKPSSPITIRKLTKIKVHAETAKKLQFADESKTSPSAEPPKSASPKKKGILLAALQMARQEIEAKKVPPKPAPVVVVSDDEVVEASPEAVTKTPRRRLAPMAPVIVLDDSVDDTKENSKPVIARKPRAKKAIQIGEDTPKRTRPLRTRK